MRTAKKIQKQLTSSHAKAKLMTTPSGAGFANMTYRDFQRRAIIMGMPFPDACGADCGTLQSFILKSDNQPDPSLIQKYDDWMDQQLARKYPENHPMRSYQLRLGYVSEENTRKKAHRIKGIPKLPKVKREKDTNGLWKGTKKSYTFELTDRGYSLERITRRVQKKFPEAKPKSIQQWYRMALRKKGIDYKTLKKDGKCQS